MKNHIIFCFAVISIFYSNCFAKEIKYVVAEIPKELLKNSKAVVRNEEIVFELKSIGDAEENVTQAITILNKNALENSYLTLFYDKFIKIHNISCKVYDQFGKVIKHVPADDVLDYSAISGYSIYEDNRVKFVDPKVQDYPFTVEYSYARVYKGLLDYPIWHPIEDYNISIEKSNFKVIIPKNLLFRYLEQKMPTQVIKSTDENNNIYTWQIDKIPSIEEEMFNPPLTETIPCVITAPNDFKLADIKGNFESWNNFGNWIALLNKGRDSLSQDTKNKLIELTANAKDDYEKAKILYDYMQNKTRYVSIQIGLGGLQPFEADLVDRLSYGDCKALANYMKSLLKAIGIESFYCLVKAGSDASDIKPGFPYDDFNHAFLMIPQKNDTIWLECTNQLIPFGYIGDFTDDRDVLVIKEDGGEIVHTKAYKITDNTQFRKAEFTLDEDGNGAALMTTRYAGINYFDELPYIIMTNEDAKKELYKNISLSNFIINNFSFKEIRNIMPSIEENLSLQVNNYFTKMDMRMFLPVNQVNRFTNIPKRSAKRINPIFIKRPYHESDTIVYIIPATYKTEALPSGTKIETPYGSYESNVSFENGKLEYIRNFKIYKGTYLSSDYTAFVDFLTKVNDADNAKAVFLNKK